MKAKRSMRHNLETFADQPHVFVVGSPRSGTTMLAAALGRHPDLAYYYEPYFVWDNIEGPGDDDVRTAADVSAQARNHIIKEFSWFLKRSGKQILIEKTPENSFRIDYINRIFPQAKFIHITRDGHEAVLSLNREWKTRSDLVTSKSLGELARVIRENFVEYPYKRCWWLLVRYELKTRLRLNARHVFNKSKWQGKAGYGPRFRGWAAAFEAHDLLSFNAWQWRKSVEACIDGLAALSEDRVLTLKYEDLMADPRGKWAELQDFVGVRHQPNLTPEIQSNWASRERKKIDPGTMATIDGVIAETLKRLGYATPVSIPSSKMNVLSGTPDAELASAS